MEAPEIEWDLLLDQIEAGRVIPVLGQGLLSFGEGDKAETLDQILARGLMANLKIPPGKLGDRPSLETVICSYAPFRGNQLLAQAKLRAVYQEVFRDKSALGLPDALRWLATIRHFNLFVCLTIDDLLEGVIEEIRGLPTGTAIPLANAQKNTPDITSAQVASNIPIVFRLFGRIPKGSDFALTDEDTLEYLHHMQSPAGRPARLFQEFRGNNLLLIGTGFPEWKALFFLRATRGERLRKERGEYIDFIVEPQQVEDQRLGAFLTNHAAPTTLFFQTDPVAFVRELCERWTERNKEKPAQQANAITPQVSEVEMEAPIHPDVFLSYATEDREAALTVFRRLSNYGLKVWFDQRGGVECGQEYQRRINKAIADCVLFLPLLSKNVLTQEERFFKKEWFYAFERLKGFFGSDLIFILPVRTDDVDFKAPYFPGEFSHLSLETAPRGELSPEFVGKVVREVRRHQAAADENFLVYLRHGFRAGSLARAAGLRRIVPEFFLRARRGNRRAVPLRQGPDGDPALRALRPR